MITLDAQEKLIAEVRRHWFAFFTQIFGVVIGILVPVVLIPVFALADASLLQQHWTGYTFFSFVWLLLLWMMAFIAWTNHHLDVLFVTTKRVIDIEQHNLFSHDLAEVRIDHIQDIKVEVLGLIPTLLNYGNIHIQTSGAQKEFVVRYVPNPHKVKECISQQQA